MHLFLDTSARAQLLKQLFVFLSAAFGVILQFDFAQATSRCESSFQAPYFESRWFETRLAESEVSESAALGYTRAAKLRIEVSQEASNVVLLLKEKGNAVALDRHNITRLTEEYGPVVAVHHLKYDVETRYGGGIANRRNDNVQRHHRLLSTFLLTVVETAGGLHFYDVGGLGNITHIKSLAFLGPVKMRIRSIRDRGFDGGNWRKALEIENNGQFFYYDLPRTEEAYKGFAITRARGVVRND